MPYWRTAFLTVTAGTPGPRCWFATAALLGLALGARSLLIGRKKRLPAGAFLAPGYIDLQVNGGGEVLLNDQPTADGMRAIARAHRRYGTTACIDPISITRRR